ncbi:beta-lactamase [Pseudomonas reactans]|uniref:class C beta-lactamase n=1 Tax=Pseudomonas reactans TaxID=117680 RepID=UPI0015A4DBFB|nr:class C beta-lactamase [Pseudomonas reactans]NWC88488.1 beta-lactamase [Pseudomonas reactans]NWD33949.1 beta-lactamase [Pseudomonas reactans]
MPQFSLSRVRNVGALALFLATGHCLAADDLRAVVDASVKPLMQQQSIPGLVVGVIKDGKAQYFNYGVASKDAKQPVSENTLFEIGSVSKTFTATLAGYAVASGKLTLTDPASQYLPALRGGKFDHISLLNLGTYTAGGLPLQFPREADNTQHMISYFQQWKPDFAPGTQRLYSNPSLGLFGYLAAQSLKQPFGQLMEKTLLPKLGLKHTFVTVPKSQMNLYAQGYGKDGKPVRVGPGAMDSEAYGIKTSASDLLHYVEVNMRPATLDPVLQQAITTTHTGYYTVEAMTQGLGWEMYPYPIKLDALVEGNSTKMAMEPHPVNWLTPAQAPHANTLVNKTGSTNGFGAYVAYVPSKEMGVVILANKNYPNGERVKVAHAILSALDH